MTTTIKKLLIANRGEIAVRVDPGLSRAGHRDGRRLLRGRPRGAARAAGRRGLSDRARRRRPRAIWPSTSSWPWRARCRRRRRPSRLRVPRRERALRRGVRAGRAHVRRPAAGRHPRHGRQDRRAQDRARPRGADGAGHARADRVRRRGAHAGRGRSAIRSCSRRRWAAAARACAWSGSEAELADALRARALGGGRGVRRRRGLSRALRRASRGTSRSRCWPTRTATSCTWASANARSSGATRS